MTTETAEERDARLERVRAAQQERLAVETAEDRDARLERVRASNQDRYDRDAHSERSVQRKMLNFHNQIASLNCPQCTTCCEGFPGLRFSSHCAECMRCSQDKHIPKCHNFWCDLCP